MLVDKKPFSHLGQGFWFNQVKEKLWSSEKCLKIQDPSLVPIFINEGALKSPE